MNNVRLFLWLTLLAFGWLVYTAWVQDHPTLAPPQATTTPATPSTAAAPPSLPSLETGQTAQAPLPPQAPMEHGELIHVRTDVLDVVIDSHGGDLVRADLREYPVDKKIPDKLVRLLDDSPADLWVFQTGLRSAIGGAEPNHLGTFRTANNEYALAPGQNELVVSLDWVGEGPVSARKVYTFRRGQYGIDLTLSVQPSAGGSWRGAPYAQMVRLHNPPKRSYTSVDSYSFTGPVLFNGDKYEKLDFKKITDAPVTQTVKGGWFAAIQHHFLAAAVPPPADDFRYDASTRGQEFLLSAIGPVLESTAATPLNYTFKLFVGPKLQNQLQAIGEKLDLTVDYGRLTLIAHPMFLLLSFIERWVNNWGWAIVIVTMMIKLVFYKLTATSGRSMAKMRRLAPRIKALQETYKDDRQALSQKMMELYKREKVNPAAGCLPIVIQMPFFFAFYWVLIESVEMRQAPFMLWINDLSSRDPYFVLPLLMGIAMFLQSRLSPAPPDPMQARVMQIMPVAFSVMFAFFPAGLVLYWFTNTLLSILQQWRINQLVARENANAPAG
ncbi:MAG TPA: membrane protein insertase YidC [Gammaproteobacteria bacterium]|nr:membrane protein insertase YidC [Gammaproteobacteria bacterium]